MVHASSYEADSKTLEIKHRVVNSATLRPEFERSLGHGGVFDNPSSFPGEEKATSRWSALVESWSRGVAVGVGVTMSVSHYMPVP